MRKLDKKAFTLIELIVTIAVLGVLVLLASPRFFGHTQNTEFTKGFANARSIEKASELYYMDHEDWPRLTDEPYTSEEIESYSEKIFDRTGHEVNLDTEGNYYDIDYDKLSDYIQVPDDKKNYILQNPVGKVFYMDNLNEAGIARVNYSSAKEEDDNPIGLRKPTEEEIAIATADELAKIGTSSEYPLDGKYILTANIDLSGYSEGEGWTPIGNDVSKFTGSFDGNGYKITNLTIDKPSQNYVGLFGRTEGATISNVALEDINVTGRDQVGGLAGYVYESTIISSYTTGSVTGTGNYAGGLVGGATSNSKVSKSYVTGSVTSSGKNIGGLVGGANSITISNSYATGSATGLSEVGGLVGWAKGSTISNSYATGDVTGTGANIGGLVGDAWDNTEISNSYAKGSVTGLDHVGGLVGRTVSSTIENSYATGEVEGLGSGVLGSAGGLVGWAGNSMTSNSYATGSVTGTEMVGGLVGGASSGTISSSYATGFVVGKAKVGGLMGYTQSSTKISNSYWNKETTKQSISAGGTGKTTNEMKKRATYSGWDFENVWKIDVGNDYPKLR